MKKDKPNKTKTGKAPSPLRPGQAGHQDPPPDGLPQADQEPHHQLCPGHPQGVLQAVFLEVQPRGLPHDRDGVQVPRLFGVERRN